MQPISNPLLHLDLTKCMSQNSVMFPFTVTNEYEVMLMICNYGIQDSISWMRPLKLCIPWFAFYIANLSSMIC